LVDALALVYYRDAWAIDYIGSFAEQVLMPEESEAAVCPRAISTIV
jgi:hypothetical protein